MSDYRFSESYETAPMRDTH